MAAVSAQQRNGNGKNQVARRRIPADVYTALEESVARMQARLELAPTTEDLASLETSLRTHFDERVDEILGEIRGARGQGR